MRFEPGISGNIKGRPKGALNKHTQLSRLLEPHAALLINKTVELALNGDINALRLCIERLIPKAKENVTKVVIPESTGQSIDQILIDMFYALKGQELTISELRELMGIVYDKFTLTGFGEIFNFKPS